jgi:septal ring factor EnvC (AmiA/AmiB activator)
MAERASRRGKRRVPARRKGGARSAAATADSQAQRIKTLERECERLKGKLAEAEERFAGLEERRTEAVNRIDWVIDSLHNVLESGA